MSTKFRMQPIAALALMLTALSLTGCAYDGYKSGEVYDKSIHTVAVPIFSNRSFFREMEFSLTEALTKEIESRTPYKAAAADHADTQITGTILSVDKRLLSRDFDTSVSQEVQMTVVAAFEWKDLRTGKIIRKRSRITGAAEYIPSQPLGEPEQVARLAAVDELAREIVSLMQSDW